MGEERFKGIFRPEGEVPPNCRLEEACEQREYLVDGELRRWEGALQEVFSPVLIEQEGRLLRKRIGSYPLLGEAEALGALEAAARAYDHGSGRWPTLRVEERIRSVESFLRGMVERRAQVVRLLMWEIGKSLEDSEKEFDRTAAYISATLEALKRLDRDSSRFTIEEGVAAQIRRAPLGVVLCMGPFNYPLNETFTTLIPALIMGNTVVVKPPKIGVLLFRPLLEVFLGSFPQGVVNFVYGEGQRVVGPLMESGRIDALAFIGSDRVADILKHQHPKPHRLRSVLGLGAKNAAIVLDSADLKTAVQECALGALSFNGQRCTALKILFVHRKVVEPFLQAFCERVNSLKAAMPWEQGAVITPLPEENKIAAMRGYVEDALGRGARIVNPGGGESLETLFAPAVLYPVDKTMRIYHEEQFGPVVPVVPFDSIQEPLEAVRDSPYGQQISLFGQESGTLARLIDPLVNQVCRVNLNSQCQRGPDLFPFTGRKDSAEGTLSVSDALRVFSIRTLVAAKKNETNQRILREILRQDLSTFLSTDFLF